MRTGFPIDCCLSISRYRRSCAGLKCSGTRCPALSWICKLFSIKASGVSAAGLFCCLLIISAGSLTCCCPSAFIADSHPRFLAVIAYSHPPFYQQKTACFQTVTSLCSSSDVSIITPYLAKKLPLFKFFFFLILAPCPEYPLSDSLASAFPPPANTSKSY